MNFKVGWASRPHRQRDGRPTSHEPEGRAGCPQPAANVANVCGAVRTPRPTRFMVPMRDSQIVEAFHEPTEGPPGFGLRQSSGAFRSGLGAEKRQRTAAVQDAIATAHPPARFKVPMQTQKRKEALHEPAGSGTGVSPVLPSSRARRRGDARATISPHRFIIPIQRFNGSTLPRFHASTLSRFNVISPFPANTVVVPSKVRATCRRPGTGKLWD